MGSYGIGPARIAAAAVEQGADERGIVWPAAIAPWRVHIAALGKADDEVGQAAAALYEELTERGVETVIDDRDAGPGEKLTVAELLGCPLRITVGRRGLADGKVEAQVRRTGDESNLPAGDVDAVADLAASLE
jgi:prolyl-tRNA synthetase